MVKWKTNLVNAFPDPYLNGKLPPAPSSIISQEPFPFFKLPSEVRNRIYALVLFTSTPYSTNTIAYSSDSRTSLLLASRRLHVEASYVLYSSTTFRIFPLQAFTCPPTVQNLPIHYRNMLTTLELVLGPSWTNPPKSWKVNKSMARILGSLGSVHTLKVFVEVDPTHPLFAGFRVSHGFYTEFGGKLLGDVLKAMPTLQNVQISGHPSVQMDGPLVSRLRQEVQAQGRVLRWDEMAGKMAAADTTADVAPGVKSVILEDEKGSMLWFNLTPPPPPPPVALNSHAAADCLHVRVSSLIENATKS